MGIYYKLINHDRKEMICPGELGEGLKGRLLYQKWTHRVLIWLLQFGEQSGYEGTWSNTRVSVVADYGDEYENANEENGWKDIGPDTLVEMSHTYDMREEFLEDTKDVQAWDKDLIALRARVAACAPGSQSTAKE